MAKKRNAEPEPAIRKSLLITGGVAVAAALLGFIVMTFVVGGGGGGETPDGPTAGEVTTTNPPAAPNVEPQATPVPPEPDGLTPGGRDPFNLGRGSAPAQGSTSDGSDP